MYTQLIGLCLLAAAALAQAPAPKETPNTPRIPAEMRARFWRTQAEAMAAETRAKQAQEAAKAAQDDMRKACGDGFALSLDTTGEPACRARQ